MAIIISPRVREKLLYKIPPVRPHEIDECFDNKPSRVLIDKRKKHKTRFPTLWFIAETDAGRRLKIVFLHDAAGNRVLKTAVEPNLTEEKFYAEKTKTRDNY